MTPSITAAQIVLSIIVLLNAGLATFVLLKNPKRLVNRSFFLLIAGVVGMATGIVLLSATGNFIFDKVIFFGGHTMFLGLVLLARTFPDVEQLPKKSFPLFVPFLILYVITPFNVLVTSVDIGPGGFIQPTLGPAFPLFILFVAWATITSLYFFARRYRELTGKARLQMNYLLTGATVFAVSLFIFNVALPGAKIFTLNFLGPSSSIVFVALTSYSIVRHELLDIKVVIQRGAIYSMLAAIVVGSYLLLVALLGFVFQQVTDITILISAGITMLVGIFTVPSIEAYFRQITDRFFFKHGYDYSRAIHNLVEAIETGIEPNEIITAAEEQLQQILKPEFVRISLDGQSNQPTPSVEKTELSAPIVRKGKHIGNIVLGPKKSGDPYSTHDKQLLRTFSKQASVAFARAQLHEEVKEHSRELETKVKQRTKELEDLQQSQEQVMLDISHGLQTPLTSVKSALYQLRQEGGSTPILNRFERSIDEVSHFVYDMLHFAEVETHPTDTYLQELDLSATLKDLIETYTISLPHNHITLNTDIEDDIHILGKKEKIIELINNLVSNASKYMREEKRNISICLSREDKHAVITVADTGIGIRANDLPRVFDRFYRVNSMAHRARRGSGLGLAICKRIVEAHNGTINVTSTPGVGSTFTVVFPTHNF